MSHVSVLVVDDSPSMRLMLNHALELDARIKVLAMVNDGQAAIDYLAGGAVRPDVVLMDIHMPRIDGFETTRRIMETNPLPIVICTATADPQELQVAFRSMEAGAVACVEKPVGYEDPRFETLVQNLLQTVRLMAEVKVMRRWPRPRLAGVRSAAETPVAHRLVAPRIVGIGASTGGPPVLQNILSGLPRDFPAPLVIVQHIARGFLPGMVEWLNSNYRPARAHRRAWRGGGAGSRLYRARTISISASIPQGDWCCRARPPKRACGPRCRSCSAHWRITCGAQAVGVLLTGMGRDGADELKRMRDRGALTIAQDRDSSVVHGMPGAAIEMGAATQILPAERIAGALIAELTRRISASWRGRTSSESAVVLIAEDSPTQAQQLAHILEAQGLQGNQRRQWPPRAGDGAAREATPGGQRRDHAGDERLRTVLAHQGGPEAGRRAGDPGDHAVRSAGRDPRPGVPRRQFRAQALRRRPAHPPHTVRAGEQPDAPATSSPAWAWRSCSAGRSISSPPIGCRSSTCCCRPTKPPSSATAN